LKNSALQSIENFSVVAHQKILQRILTAASFQRLWVLQADESTSVKNAFDKNSDFRQNRFAKKYAKQLLYCGY